MNALDFQYAQAFKARHIAIKPMAAPILTSGRTQ
jgi:hypothetical protein